MLLMIPLKLFLLICWLGCVTLEEASSLTPRGVAWLHEVLCYLNIGSWGDKSLRDSRKIFWFELNWAFSTARYVGRIEESFLASRTQAVDLWLWCWSKWVLQQGWDLLPPSKDLSPLTPFLRRQTTPIKLSIQWCLIRARGLFWPLCFLQTWVKQFT